MKMLKAAVCIANFGLVTVHLCHAYNGKVITLREFKKNNKNGVPRTKKMSLVSAVLTQK